MKVLVTGAAGFIGSALSIKLLERGDKVVGIDNHNDYYDPELKEARLARHINEVNYTHIRMDIEDGKAVEELFNDYQFDGVVNLAAQAGVRYSIENPLAYINTNMVGFSHILEGCRHNNVSHLVYASSSSVYGSNTKIPFSVHDSVEHPLSLYGATKKANELMAHTYSHLYNLPTTGLRFFTVYGPWGRPDMALFKFTKGIINKKKIDIYNKGKMYRDFTYIDDIVNGITSLINKPPNSNQLGKIRNDSLSPVAPFRILNIGNTKKVFLLDFINELEKQLGKKAIRNYMSMQKGDVKITVSNTSLLKKITKYNPKTHYKTGIKKFLEWYLFYYKIKK